jgi:hypothetical protein
VAAVQGYFKNNIFINESHIPIPEGQPVIITILNDGPAVSASESKRQKVIFSEFYAAIQADSEILGEEFDKTLADRLHFRETDVS